MKKNIIFDLDGTLIDSMGIWDNIGRDFLKKLNVNVPDDLEEIWKQCLLKRQPFISTKF